MANTLAIAGKELRSYFASPIAYVVIGLYALLFGYFFLLFLTAFAEQSMRMAAMGMNQPVNVNQMMIRPMLGNMSVIGLFILPMLTMRAYAEEKRSGTFELLLTAPLTDLQIVLGKFLGSLSLYTIMLAVSSLNVLLLSWWGNPEWRQVATSYLGLFFIGASFIALGLFISSLTKNQIVAGIITFAVALILWVISWVGDSAGELGRAIVSGLSVIEHYDDFSKGVVDTKHVVYYLSFIAFGLFLTVKSVDSERWRG